MKQAAHLSEFGSALSLPPQSRSHASQPQPCRPQRLQSHRRRGSRREDSNYLQLHSGASYLRRYHRREPHRPTRYYRSRCLLTFTTDLSVISRQCDLSLGSMTGQGVVWDQQYKQDRENPERTSHMPTNLTPQIINAAIIGFEQEKLRIDTQIAELRSMLDGGPTKSTPAATQEPPILKRRKFSAAARRRMKEAQQLRWAKIRGESEPPATATAESSKPKRKLSAAGRKAISDATKKRWAAVHAAAAKTKPAAEKKAAAKKAVAKRKLSPARKAALVANLAKARAAKAAKATAGAQ